MTDTAKAVAIVTGASSGIGQATALGLAQAGMHVVMVGRDPNRTEAARRIVAAQVPGAELDIALADFSSLDTVRALAADLLARHTRLDVLINNAGLISRRYAVSAEGYELTVAVNHLAPFLLTNLLLDRLTASAPARIVTVASTAHRGVRLDLATMTHPPNWSPMSAYGRSKLANILFTRELAHRLDPAVVMAACLHPGVIATAIGDSAGTLGGLGWRIAKAFLPGPEKGAETSVFLATVADPTPFHGEYVIDKRVAETDPAARDDRLAAWLWEESAALVGL